MRLYLSSFRMGNRPDELINLLGDGRRTAVIMNAADASLPERRAVGLADELARLREVGLDPVEFDLREYFGRSDAARDALKGFDLVWVRGGNTFVLRRAFKYSGMDEILKELLLNDALAYGGYSAGIDLLTPSLHGSEEVDDPNAIPEGYQSEIIWDGLNLLPYSVAPHYRSDHPESAAVEQMVQHLIDNHLLFKALRDGQAIVVNGDREWIAG